MGGRRSGGVFPVDANPDLSGFTVVEATCTEIWLPDQL